MVLRSKLFKVPSSGQWTVDLDTKLLYICWYNANISIQIPTNEDPVLSQAEATDQTEKERMGTMQTSQYPCVDIFNDIRPQPLSFIVLIGPLASADIKHLGDLKYHFSNGAAGTSIPLCGFPIEFIKASYWIL